MAEFSFYGTVADWDTLLGVVFSHAELCVIPDVFYPTVKAICYRRDSKGFRLAFEKKRGLFIKGPFTLSDVVLRPCGKLGHYVDEVTLGPLIRLFLPGNERSPDGLLLRPGWLLYQSEYWSEDRSASFRPSPELKAACTGLKREFEHHLVLTEISTRVWIGKQALQRLTSGKAMILIKGKWHRFRDGVPRLDKREGL